MAQSFTNLLYHIIFSTKERQPLIKLEYQPRLYDYIGGIIRGVGGISLGIDGVEDHVHVLAKLRPDRALSDVLRDLKANATGWMHDLFPPLADFYWQRGYAAFTVSQSHVPQVQQYFKTEGTSSAGFISRCVLQFLKANGIEYDERFV